MLTLANNEYRFAVNELSRPASDIVHFAVCMKMKEVVTYYFRAFLLFREMEPNGITISHLYKQCSSAEKDFNRIDLAPILCKAEKVEENKMYCLSHGRIQDCFETIKSVKEVVLGKILKPKDKN